MPGAFLGFDHPPATREANNVVPVLVFADFTCPYSYVTERALRRRARMGGVEITYRAFELFPDPAPVPQEPERLPAELLALAEAEGVRFGTPALRPRTQKAHELARFAAERGVEPELRDALYRAHWQEARDIGRIDVLTEIGAALGLDAMEIRIALDIERFTAAVGRDREAALRLGIHGTPAVIVGTGERAQLLLGAHGYAQLDEVIATG